MPRGNILTHLVLLVALLSSCTLGAPPAAQPLSAEDRATVVAATLEAHALQSSIQTRQAQLTAEMLTRQAPGPTSTIAVLQPTPSPTDLISVQTLTPPLPSATPTGITPTITAQADTNCRARPEKDAERLAILYMGQQSTVLGYNADQTWWYIENPDLPGEACWVWAQTTTVSGQIAGLPIITPAPPPKSVSFEASFSNVHECGYDKFLVFRVENTGTETFYLAKITVQTPKGLAVIGPKRIDVPYMSAANNCPPGIYILESGKRGFIPLKKNVSIAHGARLQAVIELCTEEGPEKKCVGQTISFVYP